MRVSMWIYIYIHIYIHIIYIYIYTIIYIYVYISRFVRETEHILRVSKVPSGKAKAVVSDIAMSVVQKRSVTQSITSVNRLVGGSKAALRGITIMS